MNRSMRLLTVSFCIFVLNTVGASPLKAKGRNVTIDKSDQKTTIACTGNAVTVTSDDNEITLIGECSKLTVKGKDNNVTAAAIKEVVVSGTDVNVIVASVGKITVTGNDVNVVWANGIGGKQPKISQKKGNDINIVHNGK
jgi:methyl coenzyme M reductase beta subunit